MNTYIIYKCTSPSGKVYIGQTGRTLELRWKEHSKLARCGGNLPLSRAIRKHGANNFTLETVVRCVPDYMINPFEAYWINYYNSLTSGYNCTIGGEGLKGFKHTEATKRKLSKLSKGNTSALGNKHSIATKQLLSKLHTGNTYWVGKAHSEVSKEKMSKSATGRTMSEETKAKLREVNTGRMHTEATKTLMRDYALSNRTGENHSRATAVVCLDTGEIFNTIGIAAIAKNVDSSAISKCCKNKLKTTGGYSWKYKDN